MSSTIVRWAVLAAIMLTGGSGCGYFRGNASEDDTELSELDVIDKADSIERPKDSIALISPPQEGVLELHLKIGDRFPLSKTVEQRLTQTDQRGQSVSTSVSNMMLSLVVEDVRPDGRKLIKVQYHRVKYQQEIGGKIVSYSSDQTLESVPPDAYLYAGLANNWFQFWLGPNNKVIEIVGFNDFLKRCLQNVPAKYVASVQQQLEGTKTDDGISNFIDDSIGLLPFSNDPSHPGVSVKEGTRWELDPRRSEVPIPLLTTTECVLKELSVSSAEILMTGRISGPPTPVVLNSAAGKMRVQVKGGFCTGSCRVDRNTGLPTQSRIQRDLELAMELPGGQMLQQHKESVSTIVSFPSQVGVSNDTPNSRVQQVSVQTADGFESHRRVMQVSGTPAK